MFYFEGLSAPIDLTHNREISMDWYNSLEEGDTDDPGLLPQPRKFDGSKTLHFDLPAFLKVLTYIYEGFLTIKGKSLFFRFSLVFRRVRLTLHGP